MTQNSDFSDLRHKFKLLFQRKSQPSSYSPTIPTTMSLTGKIALITGGTKGIGKATALKFVREGASVVINYGRDAAAAEALVKEIGSDKALAVQGDAGKISDIERIVAAAVEKFGKLDIVMANAGTMPMKDLEHITEDDYERVMTLNVKGPLFLAQVSILQFSDVFDYNANSIDRKQCHIWPQAPQSFSFPQPSRSAQMLHQATSHTSPRKARSNK